jgi:Protein of unknown function (DUF2569)
MPAYCKRCRLHIPDGMSSCRMCGSSALTEPPAPTEGPLLSTEPLGHGQPRFSKTFFVIALGLIVAPLMQIFAVAELQTPGSYSDAVNALVAQHPGLDNIYYFEMGVNGLLVLGALVLNFLFYTRSKHFPASMVAYIALTFAYRLADAGMMHFFFPDLHANAIARAYSLARHFIVGAALGASLLLDPEMKARFQN